MPPRSDFGGLAVRAVAGAHGADEAPQSGMVPGCAFEETMGAVYGGPYRKSFVHDMRLATPLFARDIAEPTYGLFEQPGAGIQLSGRRRYEEGASRFQAIPDSCKLRRLHGRLLSAQGFGDDAAARGIRIRLIAAALILRGESLHSRCPVCIVRGQDTS